MPANTPATDRFLGHRGAGSWSGISAFPQQLTWAWLFLAPALGPTILGCGDPSDVPCAGNVARTVAAFVPPGVVVHCMDAATFVADSRQVRLTHVGYGALLDCPAGCFSSHVCAIEDPASPAPELFYAFWTSDSERPVAIATECPGLSASAEETWPACVPSGLNHPLVAKTDFRNWAAHEDQSGGPLRYCVGRYAANFSWP